MSKFAYEAKDQGGRGCCGSKSGIRPYTTRSTANEEKQETPGKKIKAEKWCSRNSRRLWCFKVVEHHRKFKALGRRLTALFTASSS